MASFQREFIAKRCRIKISQWPFSSFCRHNTPLLAEFLHLFYFFSIDVHSDYSLFIFLLSSIPLSFSFDAYFHSHKLFTVSIRVACKPHRLLTTLNALIHLPPKNIACSRSSYVFPYQGLLCKCEIAEWQQLAALSHNSAHPSLFLIAIYSYSHSMP